MIRRSFRLKATRIAYLFKKGKKVGNTHVTVKFLPSGEKSPSSRFCVVTSAKVSPKAVTRNRLRRQIYEIIRLNKELLEKKFDIAIITKPPILNLDFASMRKILTALFSYIK
jgi:ribonuclease P protein component